jgi:HlyD family secretion protein
MRISTSFPGTKGRSDVRLPSLFKQRWLLIPLILVIIAGVVFWQLQARAVPTAPTTTTVSQGNMTITVSGSGAVAAARTVDLPFQQAGTVTSVDVKVGDQVKAGQVLAQIDDSDLRLQLQQAQANLKSAEARMASANGGTPTQQDLATTQAALENARAQLTKTKTAGVTDLQNARAQLASAQAKLDALKNPTPANISAAQTQLAQAQTSLQTQRDSLSQSKTNAYNQMQQAVNSLTQAQSKYATAKKNWDYVQAHDTDPTNPTTTDASGKTKKNKLSDAQRQQYYDTFVQAEASLNSAEISVQQAQVSYDTARQNEAAQVPLLEQQLANAQTQFDALKNPSASDLRQAQAAVTQAQSQLTALQGGGTQASLTSAQSQVTQAQANLDALTAPGTASDIAAAEATVLQAQADVATAQRNLDQAALKAPFDGVVSAVSLVLGSTSNSGNSTSSSGTTSSGASITLVDRSKLHVDINLSETDAARVQVGQPVALTFDALPNVTIQGKVTTIAPAATVQQNVVTYPVQVEFDPGNTPVKVGMSTTADIQIQQVNNAILVPSRAVQTAGNNHTVTVLQGAERTPVMVQVETGPTSNGQVVITSCVDTGAQCLRPGDVLAVSSTTTTTTTQGGPGGGGFGGPRGGGFPFGRGGD